jgi:hypothetical protein
MYQLVINGVVRLSDKLVIPFAIDSPEKTEYEAWVDAGNIPRPNPPSGHHKWDNVSKVWYADAEVDAALTNDLSNSEDMVLQELNTLLPSWGQVDQVITDISNLADAKVFIRKLAKVVYRLAKNKGN